MKTPFLVHPFFEHSALSAQQSPCRGVCGGAGEVCAQELELRGKVVRIDDREDLGEESGVGVVGEEGQEQGGGVLVLDSAPESVREIDDIKNCAHLNLRTSHSTAFMAGFSSRRPLTSSRKASMLALSSRTSGLVNNRRSTSLLLSLNRPRSKT